jgi:hypothetical protein
LAAGWLVLGAKFVVHCLRLAPEFAKARAAEQVIRKNYRLCQGNDVCPGQFWSEIDPAVSYCFEHEFGAVEITII